MQKSGGGGGAPFYRLFGEGAESLQHLAQVGEREEIRRGTEEALAPAVVIAREQL